MTVREGDRDAVGREALKPVNWIAHKARFGLFSISNHGRPGCLEALNRVANGLLIQGSHRVWRDPARCQLPHRFDEFGGSWNATNRLGGNRHARNRIGGGRQPSKGRGGGGGRAVTGRAGGVFFPPPATARQRARTPPAPPPPAPH